MAKIGREGRVLETKLPKGALKSTKAEPKLTYIQSLNNLIMHSGRKQLTSKILLKKL